jgi:cbb3-type cytochrome oxidase subunit 3
MPSVIFVTTPVPIRRYDGQPYGPSTHETAIPARTRRYLGPGVFWRWSMTGFVPVMWTVWGVLVLILVALYVYRAKLTQDEDDQLILDESFDNVKNEQAEIIAKVNKIEPLVRILKWAVALATVSVLAYYIWDIITRFK